MEIPLGTAGSKIYKKEGELHYTIAPIYGKKINFTLDTPVSALDVAGKSDNMIIYKNGSYKLKMEFTPHTDNTYKMNIKPYRFWFIPSGSTSCEISKANKDSLFDIVASS